VSAHIRITSRSTTLPTGGQLPPHTVSHSVRRHARSEGAWGVTPGRGVESRRESIGSLTIYGTPKALKKPVRCF